MKTTKAKLYAVLIMLFMLVGATATTSFAAGKLKGSNTKEKPAATAPAEKKTESSGKLKPGEKKDEVGVVDDTDIKCDKMKTDAEKQLCKNQQTIGDKRIGKDPTPPKKGKTRTLAKQVADHDKKSETAHTAIRDDIKAHDEKMTAQHASQTILIESIKEDTGVIREKVGALQECLGCAAKGKSEKKASKAAPKATDEGVLKERVASAKAPEKPAVPVAEPKVTTKTEVVATGDTGTTVKIETSVTTPVPEPPKESDGPGSRAYAWKLYTRFKQGALDKNGDACVALQELIDADDDFDRGRGGYNYEQYFYPNFWKAAKVSYPACKSYNFGDKTQKQFRSTFVDGFTCGTGKDIGGRDCEFNPFMIMMQALLDYGVIQLLCGGGDTCNSFGDIMDHMGIKDQGSPNYGPTPMVNPGGNPPNGPGDIPAPGNDPSGITAGQTTPGFDIPNTWQPTTGQVWGPVTDPTSIQWPTHAPPVDAANPFPATRTSVASATQVDGVTGDPLGVGADMTQYGPMD